MITIVVAVGKNNEIGKDNQLLWHLPKDLKHFKDLTTGHPVIMGRKTYESIGKPLPNRTNIVISQRKDWFQEGILIVGTIKEAIKFAKKIGENIFIIGGGTIYKETLRITERIEMTLVDATFDADTFFPKLDMSKWQISKEECHESDEKNEFNFCFKTLDRIENDLV